ncbi:FxLYD domain-containing protein [Kitasatospora sp. NPDC048365]|uniref:FxLYD domain-containing protein n=1 Tax=Kitasatospora sp. NPDC048365 TaxID=3364050 RepID=UPI00371D98C1
MTIASDGKAEVQLNVTNHESQANEYTVQVNFTDASGNVLDAVAVNVPEVAAGATAQATAKSNRSLTGTVQAQVAAALRY